MKLRRIFGAYRMQIAVGSDVADSAVLQAALLTAVNCASRCILGGVTVVGARGGLRVTLPPFLELSEAVAGLGARIAQTLDPALPTLVVGDVKPDGIERLAVRATFAEWCGGVVPFASGVRLAETGDFIPAGVLAGGIAITEIFQRLRGGTPMACRRAAGLRSLGRPTGLDDGRRRTRGRTPSFLGLARRCGQPRAGISLDARASSLR